MTKNYTTTEKANIENVKKAYELFSSHDPSMFELFAEDIIEKQDPEPIIGKKALSEFNRAFWTGFTDIQVDLDLDRITASGDYTFASGRIRGTNDGEFPPMGLSKTGKKIDVDFVEVIKWKNGKAVLSIPLMNEEKMMRQLGLGNQLMYIFGSGMLVESLMNAGLIDEVRLIIVPIILGKGRHLFTEAFKQQNLKLISSKQFQNGGVLLRYGVVKN